MWTNQPGEPIVCQLYVSEASSHSRVDIIVEYKQEIKDFNRKTLQIIT